MMQKTLSVIDLSAIRENALAIKKMLGGRKFYAVVKADAYGHGAVEVSREVEDIADGFCVAIAEEGAELRLGGIKKPVLVLAPPLSRSDVSKCAFYDLQVTVNGVQTARLIGGLACHIKVNTGMNRYGCAAGAIDEILNIVSKEQVAGVYSHLYAAENPKECESQRKTFLSAVKKVKAFQPAAIAHLAASGGILRGGNYLFDGARCGIMLYGYSPAGFRAEGLKPALKVYAPLAQETSPCGGGVGYGIAQKKYRKLYTYRLGYADGFFRGVPLGEGNLCMDAFVSERPPFRGTDGERRICVFGNAEDYAARCSTISYEVLCSVTSRSRRKYERAAEIQI